MGALAHFIESEGVPTIGLSLIRPHTEQIQPPRALWVPFELGRPLGAPNAPDFQRKVLRAALALFAEPSGPVLRDFPQDAPAAHDAATHWACPVSFDAPPGDLSENDALRAAFVAEFDRLRSWYELGVRERGGRTTVGVSGLDLEACRDFVAEFVTHTPETNPRDDLPLGVVLKLAVEDLKAFYGEAATAQPGETVPAGEELADWLWNETVAGKVLRRVRETAMRSEDGVVQAMGTMTLVPMARAMG